MLLCSLIRQPEKLDWDERHEVELRLDLFSHIDLESIQQLLQKSTRPVVLTLRKAAHGGKFQGTESQREALIERLLSLEPPFFDLEVDMRPEFLQKVLEKYPKTNFILSYHNFNENPKEHRYIEKHTPFTYKIATMVHSTNEALRMLLFSKNHPNVSVICMGELGEFARVLGPIVGNRVNYACASTEEITAPGQLTISDMLDIYNYGALNEQTAIYGLIGDPVDKSPGHKYHNEVFLKRNLNAVYVKMVVRPEELEEFIPLAKQIGIRGLSVTIPLKEKILPFIDEIDPSCVAIGAINTLKFTEGRIKGTNTDGHGALDAIEKKGAVRGKKVVLLGAGGAARAIAFEAKQRGADVLVLNRTVERAIALGYEAGGLDEVPEQYDVLINCSPDPLPIDPAKIQPGTVAMDVVYKPRDTLFLQEAAKRNCQIVYGEEMFLNQAARQTAFWFGV
ncbi:MAG: shikimate dehydrogenase [Verrucomicrobia bacterium]|nr:shikimate dehydrogenase [Verrucomicrobiota bacterium]